MLKVNHQKNVLTLTLNRPEVRNALSEALVEALIKTLTEYKNHKDVRAVILQGAGQSFCSGGDIAWLKEIGQSTFQKNKESAQLLESLFHLINHYPKPVLGIVHGVAMGGGFGLISVCDYVLAEHHTQLSLSELKIGIVPSVIMPYVISKIGESWVRALMLTGRKLSALEALKIGLIHDTFQTLQEKEEKKNEIMRGFLSSGPQAIIQAKKLLHDLKFLPHDKIREHVIHILAEVRASGEGQEGLSAFLQKRYPRWIEEL
ncbi:MAG: enoyl-CoA hydratase/isomerase family protein [Deltaproteobacteria bacterium]|nr:enoyl-CoA hydratase/isomerase family protein [Deltaproteobacteria bacterium]